MKTIRVRQPERIVRVRFLFFIPFFLILIAGGFFYFHSFRSKGEALPIELESTFGKIELSAQQGTWVPVKFGQILKTGHRLRAGPGDGFAEFQIEDFARLRLKGNSEVEILPSRLIDSVAAQPLSLRQGTLLVWTGASKEKKPVQILVAGTTAQVEQGALLAQADSGGKAWLGVLRGSAEISGGLLGSERKKVSSSSKAEISPGTFGGRDLKISKISKEEWNQMQEAYELFQKQAAEEAEQLDLSKEAGDFFQYVFDHGTFSTPRMGFANREFIKNPSTGEVYLEAEYDVFPVGSYVGVYMKCRNLDLAKLGALKFKARRVFGSSYPESMKIEFKAKSGIVRAFVLRHLRSDWEEVIFPLNVRTPTLITEVVLLFTNEKVGIDKTGKIALKDFSLVAAEPAAAPAPAEPEPSAFPTQAPAAAQL